LRLILDVGLSRSSVRLFRFPDMAVRTIVEKGVLRRSITVVQ
jgi:hypothetical protein